MMFHPTNGRVLFDPLKAEAKVVTVALTPVVRACVTDRYNTLRTVALDARDEVMKEFELTAEQLDEILN